MPKKLTPWFRHIQPVHHGVYEVFWYASPVFARFSESRWFTGSSTVAEAKTQKTRSAGAPLKWRGLAHNPKEQNND